MDSNLCVNVSKCGTLILVPSIPNYYEHFESYIISCILFLKEFLIRPVLSFSWVSSVPLLRNFLKV